MIYKSFIMSNFNHCPIAWHFCNQSSVNKMEKIQLRALRFIYDDFESPLQDLLQKNGVLPLHISRMKLMAMEVFKIVNNIAPSYLHDLISLKPSTYVFRSEKQAQLPRVNSNRYGLRSFRYEAVRIWNSLPNEFRRDVPVGVPLDLSTPTGMSCIGTYGENCKSDNVSKYRV